MVRCDSAGSLASGWENETLPGGLNALGRETGSDSGTARLLSKPKPRNSTAKTRRKVIDGVRSWEHGHPSFAPVFHTKPIFVSLNIAHFYKKNSLG